MSLLKLSQVSFHYTQESILEKICLDFFPQEIIGLLGANGSGKTTLLKILSGVLKPKSGEVFLKEKNLKDYSHKNIAKHISVLPQNLQMDFPFSVTEVVLMGRFPYLKSWAWESPTDIAIARSAMEQVDCLQLANKNIQELSGGEKERVYLARALAQQSEILLLDEPNTHLDLAHQTQLLQLLTQLKKQNKTLIVVFHDLNLANLICDRIVLLSNHRILACGKPGEVLTDENLTQTFGVSPLRVEDKEKGHQYFLPEISFKQKTP